jgi:hypothetical protein
MRNLHDVNEALMTLLPKSLDVVEIKDYHPISLIHCIGKLISKVLANRLAPKLSEVVNQSQSVFIKGRYIQDNFKFVQATSKLLHVRKQPSLLIKIDIAKAFDSVAWLFLLNILEFLGFGRVWRDWLSALLSTSSTHVLMNGTPGDCICHARGLKQGDHLSPMLFVIVMEVLDSLFHKADSWSLFQNLGVREVPFHTSLYADDMAIFISPCLQNIQLTRGILDTFQKASGLVCNLSKSQMVHIRCSEEQITISMQEFPCQLSNFPIKYLGLPLSVSRLSRSSFQPLVDRVVDKLTAWRGRLMHRSGRLVLIKTTLSAVSV